MKKTCSVALILMTLVAAVLVMPAYGAQEDRPWTVYFNPGVRFGTDNRTLYIMDFLVPLYQGDKNILFFNPRFTPNDVKGWEVNLGFGYRQLLLDDKLILGANLYYDRRHTGWGTSHEQIGFGLEAMTEINKNLALTARFNYYIPMTDAIVTDGISGTFNGYYLRDDGIYGLYDNATLERMVEEPLQGFDAELGMRVPFVSDYVETWAYAGGYHYWGNYIKEVNGFTARLELVPTDFVRLAYEYRNDNIAGGQHYGEVMFEVPFSVENLVSGKNPFEGFGKRLSGSRDLPKRLVEPTRRDVDVNVKGKSVHDFVGDNYYYMRERIVYVSDTGSDETGDGTWSNPYHTISKAEENLGKARTIHVMNQGGGSSGAASIYKNNLIIWGSGAPNPNYPLVNFTPGAYANVDTLHILGVGNVLVTGLNFTGYPFNPTGWPYTFYTAGVYVEDNQGGIVIKNNQFHITEAFNPYIFGIVGDGCVAPGTKPIVIEDNEFDMENTTSGSANTYGIFLYADKYDSITGTVRSNDFTLLNITNGWGRTFALGVMGVSGAVPVGGNYTNASVGSDAYPFIFEHNTGVVYYSPDMDDPECGMIYTAPAYGQYELESYLYINVDNAFAFPNGTAGCNYPSIDSYIKDPIRYPGSYIHH